jgi:DNA helicase HerA-like ATPase
MTNWDESVIAKTGSGKTTTTIKTLVRLNGDEEILELIDPNGELDDWDQDRSGGTE